MRTEIFLLGIIMVIIGPVLVALAFSSCIGMIFSGNVFACVSDVPYVVIGGVFFVAGIITALVGVFTPDPAPIPPSAWKSPSSKPPPAGTQLTCKKCGKNLDPGQFFCPSCGTRPL